MRASTERCADGRRPAITRRYGSSWRSRSAARSRQASGRRLEEVLEALQRFREPVLVVSVLGEELAGLILGQLVAPGEAAHFGIGGFVRHAASTQMGQMSFLIVARAPPSKIG